MADCDSFVHAAPEFAFPESYPPPVTMVPFPCKRGDFTFPKCQWRHQSRKSWTPPSIPINAIEDLTEKFGKLNMKASTSTSAKVPCNVMAPYTVKLYRAPLPYLLPSPTPTICKRRSPRRVATNYRRTLRVLPSRRQVTGVHHASTPTLLDASSEKNAHYPITRTSKLSNSIQIFDPSNKFHNSTTGSSTSDLQFEDQSSFPSSASQSSITPALKVKTLHCLPSSCGEFNADNLLLTVGNDRNFHGPPARAHRYDIMPREFRLPSLLQVSG